ncbi:hypothetical protein FOA52_013720 [Chlamydomonas sp. UWO 241]|nr:hypothetical protein FOA52_013720 [Chlamydomonas sp. UWO 241]
MRRAHGALSRHPNPDDEAPAKSSVGMKHRCHHAKDTIVTFWLHLHCLAFLIKAVQFVVGVLTSPWRGWDAAAMTSIMYGSIYPAHMLVAALTSAARRAVTPGLQSKQRSHDNPGNEGDLIKHGNQSEGNQSQSQGDQISQGLGNEGAEQGPASTGNVGRGDLGNHFSSSCSSAKHGFVAALRWLLVDHVCLVLHLARNASVVVLTGIDVGWWSPQGGHKTSKITQLLRPQDGTVLVTLYAALAVFMEHYDLRVALLVTWTVQFSRVIMQFLVVPREELSLTKGLLTAFANTALLSAVRVAASRCKAAQVHPLLSLRKNMWALCEATSPVAASALQAPAPAPIAALRARACSRVLEHTGSAHVGVSGGGGDGSGVPLRYTSVLVAQDAGTRVFDCVTKFPSLHLSEHPHLALSHGVAALRAHLERKASEFEARNTHVAIRLVRLDVAAGCVVVVGRWEVHGAEDASEEDLRALVNDFLLEETMQDADELAEGERTPASVLDGAALDSSSVVWQPLGVPDGEDASGEASPPWLGAEASPGRAQTSPEETGDTAEEGRPHGTHPPSLEGVPLLAATTLLVALPQSGGNRVCVQFETPLLAHELGSDPDLVISFAPAGDDDSEPAPYASLVRARVGDLQADARARGNPPGLMDVDVNMEDLGHALSCAARERGGMLIVQLVDDPSLLASVLVPLLPCAASPAVVEISNLGLDERTAQHVACDLGLMLLAPRDPAPAARRLRDHARRSLEQWAQQAGHLPATLALVESVVLEQQHDAATSTATQLLDVAAPTAAWQPSDVDNASEALPLHTPAPRDAYNSSPTAAAATRGATTAAATATPQSNAGGSRVDRGGGATLAMCAGTSASAVTTAHQPAAVHTHTTNDGAAGYTGVPAREHSASATGSVESPRTLWCWINVGFCLVVMARGFCLDGPSRVFVGNAVGCYVYALPYVMILTARAYPALLARLPHALASVDPASLRRAAHFLYAWLCALALGHIPPGPCTFARTGMWTPIAAMYGLMEPLDALPWWMRAAWPLFIAATHLLVGCACASGKTGGEMLCTRDAWREYSGTFDFQFFFTSRLCVALAVEGALWCHAWWLSRRGGERRVREKQA